MAGYENTTVRDKSPTEDDSIEDETPEPTEPTEPPEVTVSSLADELAELKKRVNASQDTPSEIRKMYGTIGELNRTLQEIKNPPPAQTVEIDEDAAALDEIIEEYPVLAGPIVKNIRALQDKLGKLSANQHSAPVDDIDDRVARAVQERTQRDAVELLQEEHPDYTAVYKSQEFKTWLSTKPPEYQVRLENTWNPGIVSKGLTEFKNALKKSKEKSTRLASAITPRGVPQSARSSVLPDEDGLMIGYNSVR
jgi:hypothetical protein